jgi:hypothetical protein
MNIYRVKLRPMTGGGDEEYFGLAENETAAVAAAQARASIADGGLLPNEFDFRACEFIGEVEFGLPAAEEET